jgi:hypothetical protein
MEEQKREGVRGKTEESRFKVTENYVTMVLQVYMRNCRIRYELTAPKLAHHHKGG